MTGLYNGETIEWPAHTGASTRGVVGLRVPFAALFEANANGAELERLLAGEGQQLPVTVHGPGLGGAAGVVPVKVRQVLSTVRDLTIEVHRLGVGGLGRLDIYEIFRSFTGVLSVTLKLDVASRLIDEGDDGYEPDTRGAIWSNLGPRPVGGGLLRYIASPFPRMLRRFTLVGGYMPASGEERWQDLDSFRELGATMGRCTEVCVDSSCIGASSAYGAIFIGDCRIRALTIRNPPHAVGTEDAARPWSLFEYTPEMPDLEHLILEDYDQPLDEQALAGLVGGGGPRRIDLVRVGGDPDEGFNAFQAFQAFSQMTHLQTLVVRDSDVSLESLKVFAEGAPRATAAGRRLVLLGTNAASAAVVKTNALITVVAEDPDAPPAP